MENSIKKYNNPFYSLGYPNFRLYWVGMCISNIGTWMQNIALPWLALTTTNNPFLVSLVSASQFIPTLLLSLFSGAILDRVNKKRVLIITQVGFLLVSLSFVIMIYLDWLNFGLMIVLSFIYGIFNAFDSPCRQSFIYELVEQKEDLPNAVALNSMAFNAARVIGPSIAGIIMTKFGASSCFLINSISFLFVLVSLFFIKTHPEQVENPIGKNIIENIKDGLIYIKNSSVLSLSLIILLIVATFIPNFNVLNSAFAKYVLNGNETTFGYLMSFMGIGAFFGALLFATASRRGPSRKILYTVSILCGIFTFLCGTVNNLFTAGIFHIFNGFCYILTLSNVNSTLQINTENRYRGRVMSIYSLFLNGTTPLGNLYAGFFAERFNPRVAFYSCGLAGLIFIGIITLLRPNSIKEYLQIKKE
jgi:MFS family permease